MQHESTIHQSRRTYPKPTYEQPSLEDLEEMIFGDGGIEATNNGWRDSRVSIPVVIGRNRLRGRSEGAMVKDGLDDNLDRLRQVMREEAKLSGIESSDDWLNMVVSQLLRMYEHAHTQWQASKHGAIGHVLELALPSGKSLLFGDERVLARIELDD